MKALLTWAAVPVLFILPIWVASVFLAPGLYGLLSMLGLDLLATIVKGVLGWGAVLFFLLAAWSARGTYHFNEHVRDLAPWAITFIGLAAFFGAVRG